MFCLRQCINFMHCKLQNYLYEIVFVHFLLLQEPGQVQVGDVVPGVVLY